ncbi:MAG: hypothetical protein R3B40_29310 [Polyangiales bacterium]|nr:hypothetical protein [Myxococcales bacterium]MCB9656488.1 hypothetical protein [Sandaracinaceae bacterium]
MHNSTEALERAYRRGEDGATLAAHLLEDGQFATVLEVLPSVPRQARLELRMLLMASGSRHGEWEVVEGVRRHLYALSPTTVDESVRLDLEIATMRLHLGRGERRSGLRYVRARTDAGGLLGHVSLVARATWELRSGRADKAIDTLLCAAKVFAEYFDQIDPWILPSEWLAGHLARSSVNNARALTPYFEVVRRSRARVAGTPLAEQLSKPSDPDWLLS